ncbi:MAG: BglII/BstYI family type II restriction endonuclease [Rhodobacteraceae bacterium]|nr:BglII/BstYI family type II restriction endonuclease [Paracoccaceae bacterium]
MKLSILSDLGFDIQARNHVEAVLVEDFPEPLRELCEVLTNFKIADVELIRGGGGESHPTQRLRHSFNERGWRKRNIEISKIVDGEHRAGTTHEIDHVRQAGKGSVALEIEWNNKDPFFDRDLENFQRLHAEGAISVGIVITRGRAVQDQMVRIIHECALSNDVSGYDDLMKFGVNPTARQRKMVLDSSGDFAETWAKKFVSDKFGAATTHWEKLKSRIECGVGNPCPLLLIGIPSSVVIKE